MPAVLISQDEFLVIPQLIMCPDSVIEAVPKTSDSRRVVSCKFSENVVKGKCFLIEMLKYSALLI